MTKNKRFYLHYCIVAIFFMYIVAKKNNESCSLKKVVSEKLNKKIKKNVLISLYFARDKHKK